MKRIWILIVALLPTIINAFAQDCDAQTKENEFGVSAQIRSRAEYRNGTLSPRNEGDESSFFINERARLGFDYSRQNLQMKFSFQHVGVWGQDPQIDSIGRTVMHEAWAQLTTDNGKLFAKIGRQQLSYDGDRILGTLDWNVAGRWHDMLKLGYQDGSNTLHLLLAFNQNSERKIGGDFYDQSTAMLYKSMQGAWYHYKDANSPFNASLLFLNVGYSTMFGTKTMDALKGGNHKSWQDWGWIQLNINPRIFSTKW